MSWYIAMDSQKRVFPIFVGDMSGDLDIPHTNINAKYKIDLVTWVITETKPVVQGYSITWTTGEWCKLVTFEKMSPLPDINRIIERRQGYKGKTVIIDGEEYLLEFL